MTHSGITPWGGWPAIVERQSADFNPSRGILRDVIVDAHVALGAEHYLQLDAAKLAVSMAEHNVSRAIARPLGGELVIYNMRGNDRLLDAGPNIHALITANPWYGQAARDEIKRCHDRGAVGLYLHPSRQGFMPTDPIAEPLIELAAALHWPVTFHTGTYIESDVLAVAELARRFAGMTFVCDSAGFTDMWFELPGLLADHPNLLLCASLIWTEAINKLASGGRADRIMFGSGQPRDSLAAALKRIDRLDLSPADRNAILGGNAMRVYRLHNEPIAAA